MTIPTDRSPSREGSKHADLQGYRKVLRLHGLVRERCSTEQGRYGRLDRRSVADEHTRASNWAPAIVYNGACQAAAAGNVRRQQTVGAENAGQHHAGALLRDQMMVPFAFLLEE
jgi:hypothetical protein